MTSTKPTFRIVEYTPPVVDYEEFKKDFLDCEMTIPMIKEKYNLSKSEFNDYRRMVLDETGLKRKPYCQYLDPLNTKQYEFIYQNSRGDYIVHKTFKNKGTRYYGRYDDYDTARMVRDKLVESSWDDALGMYLRDKYALNRKKPSLDKALEHYDEFEDYYFNSPLPILEICDKMGIKQKEYRYLVAMIREKHGVYYRRSNKR